MNVNLNLIILHLDLQQTSSGCLVDDGHLISRSLSHSDIEGELRDILLEYLALKSVPPKWIRFHLVDVINTESDINIVYSCLIPMMIQSKKGQWTPLGMINDKQTQRLVFQAGQKTYIGY